MDLNYYHGPMEKQLVYRINENGVGPDLLQQVFLERGWVEFDEEIHGENGWNIWWRTSRFRTNEYFNLTPWQRINHYPNCTTITKKDALCRNMRKMRIAHGLNIYNFSPLAYNLPNDYTKFVSEYAKHKSNKDKSNTPLMWICKPAESSRGRGIFIFRDLSDLQYDCNAVVQQYITDPLLIGGYKFDIRVYVAVPSFHPLNIYVHEEGLVRFSTEKYDLDRPHNVFAHLTNTSINKYSPGYTKDKEEVGHGCKWTIAQLRRYFLQNDIEDGPLWQKITNIIILTLLIQAPSAPRVSNCFEVYGFDILVDSSLKPWLLEVNFSPALSSDCQADITAKKSMLHDLFDLVVKNDLALDLDSNHNRGLQNMDGLTARTVGSIASTSRSFTDTSRPLHQSHPSLSTHTLHSCTSSEDLVEDPSLCEDKSVSSNRFRYRTEKINGNLVTAMPRKSFSVTHTQATNTQEMRYRPKSSTSHFNLRKAGSKESLIGSVQRIRVNSMNRIGALRDERRKSAKAREAKSQTVDKTSVGDTLQNCSSEKSPENLSHGQHSETPAKLLDSKTSTNSDSGMSSLSLNSSGNNSVGTNNNKSSSGHSPGGSTPDAVSNTNTTSMKNGKTCLGSDLIHRLNELPPKMIHKDMKSPNQNMDTTDYQGIEEDDSNLDIKLVPGNMRGTGVKKVVSPISSPTLSKTNRLHMGKSGNHQATKEYGKGNATHSGNKASSTSGRTHSQNPSRNHSYEPHPADNKTMIKFSIPRNFSLTESHRFPHQYHHHHHHHRNPGKNGKAPLSRIPSRKVGRFFLVFPFNETTQKMALNSRYDAKVVYKELQKAKKEFEQGRKSKSFTDASSCEDTCGGIWLPMSESEKEAVNH